LIETVAELAVVEALFAEGGQQLEDHLFEMVDVVGQECRIG
jgi:hypothetical protein